MTARFPEMEWKQLDSWMTTGEDGGGLLVGWDKAFSHMQTGHWLLALSFSLASPPPRGMVVTSCLGKAMQKAKSLYKDICCFKSTCSQHYEAFFPQTAAHRPIGSLS